MKYTYTLGINSTVLQVGLVIFALLALSTLYAVDNHECETAFLYAHKEER